MDDPTPADPAPAPADPGPATAEVPWTPAAAAAAPAAALPATMVYGDLPNRIIAYIIDIIVLAILGIGVAIVLGIVGISVTTGTGAAVATNFVGTIIVTVVGLAISAAYFLYSWTNQRATIGMKALGLQIGNAPDGATIAMNEAVKRWLALGAAFSIAQLLNPLPLIGLIISIAAFAWFIFLLYTTWKSPTKQGWHDVFANTMIVKATKAAG
jgi:uncharacterized RDD family membrane protein YckC